jgi:UDP-N-acetylglucosamine acyltransferase
MSNRIHPTAVIGDEVELGDGNVVGPYSVVLGPCRIGDGNWIGPHVAIGGPAEHRDAPHPVAWDGERDGAGVRIGDHNVIREFTTISQGFHRPTRIADDCYVMGRVFVGHDTLVDYGATITSGVQIGGHCEIWALANLGLGTVVHQHTRIGPGAMLGMGAVVSREIGPFAIAVGCPARVTGVNAVGLRRRGCDERAIAALVPFVTDDGALPDGLPAELVGLLKRWLDRTSNTDG